MALLWKGEEYFKPCWVAGVHADQLAHATIHKGEGVKRVGEWARTYRSSVKAESSSSLEDLRVTPLTTCTVSCGSSCGCDAVAATAVVCLALADL
jgi:hypothetical protein